MAHGCGKLSCSGFCWRSCERGRSSSSLSKLTTEGEEPVLFEASELHSALQNYVLIQNLCSVLDLVLVSLLVIFASRPLQLHILIAKKMIMLYSVLHNLTCHCDELTIHFFFFLTLIKSTYIFIAFVIHGM